MSDHAPDAITGVSGVVKWFDLRKGYGFLVGPQNQDVFVHFSVIQGHGFRALRDGTTVVYDAVRSDKGWKATRVERPGYVRVTVLPQKPGYTRSPRR